MPLAIALATAATLAVFVAFPLLAPDTEGDQLLPVDVTPLADFKRRRMVVYENLQDLEFEFKAGKIAREDYQTLSDNYKAEAAGLMAASLEAETTSHGDAWIESRDVRQAADLGSKAVRCLFENAAILERGAPLSSG